MTTKTKYRQPTIDEIDRLANIRNEIQSLADEARRILYGTSQYELARGYCLAQIEIALSGEHGYVGRSMYTLQDAIDFFNIS